VISYQAKTWCQSLPFKFNLQRYEAGAEMEGRGVRMDGRGGAGGGRNKKMKGEHKRTVYVAGLCAICDCG
jgi:hypothetical protein